MRTNQILVVIITVFLFAGCTSGKKSSSGQNSEPAAVWVNKEKMQGKTFKKIFIVALSADVTVRPELENDLAAAATSRGHEVVKSIDVIPMSLQNPKAPTKDEVVAKVKETGCDAVFIASLLKQDESIHYTAGTTAYAVTPYSTYMGGYYSYWYQSVSTPDYWDKNKVYFMQSNLYDAASEEIMWSVQSKVFNPSSLEKFSKDYMSGLVKGLEKEKLLKK
jgi:hypothetical protein